MSQSLNWPLPPILASAAAVLGENLRRSQPLATYQLAQARLEADREARALLQRLTDAQAVWRSQQAQGDSVRSAAEQLRGVQEAVRTNAVIGEYGRSQQAASAYLREINGEISQVLGIDFGALARHGGCCS